MGRTEYLNDPAAPKPNSLVPAAGVLAVDDAGRVLLQRRRDTGQFAIPMGKQEIGETVAQCAVRETQEETGIRTEVTGILGIYSDPGHVVYYDSDGETRQEFEIILLGRPVAGQPTANDEATDVGWYTVAELHGLDIHPTQWRQLRDWIDGTHPHIDLAIPRRTSGLLNQPGQRRTRHARPLHVSVVLTLTLRWSPSPGGSGRLTDAPARVTDCGGRTEIWRARSP